MKGVIYCRVSSAEQIQGTSLESQERLCREFAILNQIQVVGVFVDRGESAKYSDRPKLLELLAYCQQHRGTVEVVLVWKLDRLARNVTDHFMIKAQLRRFHINLRSVTEPIGTTPEGNLLEALLAGFAQFDNDMRTMRSAQGMKERIRQGLWPWVPPLGYMRGGVHVADQPDPLTFEVVRAGWRMLALGQKKVEVARFFRDQGICSRSGQLIAKSALDRVFSHRYYVGEIMDPWSKEIFPGRHRAMISVAEFELAQEQMRKRTRSGIRVNRVNPALPLRGLLLCPRCQQRIRGGVTKRGNRHTAYYDCRSGCKWRWRAERLHQYFSRCLDRLDSDLGKVWQVQGIEYQRQLAVLFGPALQISEAEEVSEPILGLEHDSSRDEQPSQD